MREVQATLGKDIRLGRRGESHARCVMFDVSEWQNLYGEGVVHLLHQRNGDESPYPCQISVDGGCVCWVVTGADVAVAGKGSAELQYHVGDTCVKSDIYNTNTVRSMSDSGPVPPTPQEGWVAQVLDAADGIVQNAQWAQEAVDHYPKAKDGTWWVWDAEKDAFVDTGTPASGVYVGSGDMPEGCSVQIDPDGEVIQEEDLIGPAGKDGGYFIPVVHHESPNSVRISFSASQSGMKYVSPVLVTLPAGATGARGPAGADGYTPQKGVDYYTEADKQEMVSAVLAELPNGDEVSY